MALQLGKWIDNNIIYISGEETEYQLSSRANRLKISGKNLSLLSEAKLENILETLKNNKSDLVIIDSISVIYSENISGVA
jgi:DNA repair protein RadA/Sms